MANHVERMQKVFREVLERDDLVLTREMTAADVEEWDSLTHIHLIVGLEKEFKVSFQTGEILNLKNVGEMMDVIEKKLK